MMALMVRANSAAADPAHRAGCLRMSLSCGNIGLVGRYPLPTLGANRRESAADMSVNRFCGRGNDESDPVSNGRRQGTKASDAWPASQVARILALVAALMLTAFSALVGEASSQTEPVGLLESEHSFKDYTLRIYRENDAGDGSFEILRQGKRVHIQHGHKFQLASFSPHFELPGGRIPFGC